MYNVYHCCLLHITAKLVILAQKISPDSKEKVQLQLIMHNGEANTFHFRLVAKIISKEFRIQNSVWLKDFDIFFLFIPLAHLAILVDRLGVC